MKDLLDLITENFAAVLKAPIPFFVCLLVAGFVIYQVVKNLKAQEIADLTSRLNLKNDQVADYQRKLEGKSPDEAKAQIDDLTRRLARLEPATLTADQRNQLIAAARAQPGIIVVRQNMAAVRMGDLHAALSSAFQASGWHVLSPQSMGIPHQAAPVVVLIENPLAMTAAQRAACAGLTAAGVDYHVVAGAPMMIPTGLVADIEITLSVG